MNIAHTETAIVNVTKGYVRETLPGTKVSSAYFTVTNPSERELILVAAHSEASARIEIHEHLLADGMAKMRQREQVIIPAHQSVEFKPGGYHLMLFELAQPLKADTTVALTLMFRQGLAQQVELPVMSLKHSTHHHH